jgi:hypothetical protein
MSGVRLGACCAVSQPMRTAFGAVCAAMLDHLVGGWSL